jgi:membrane-associated protein
MELIKQLVEFLLRFDKHLSEMLDWAGPWTYVLLFAIVFCETGLVVTPFLPGDSLLFVAGALAATGKLSLAVVLISLIVAAVLGDAVNYFLGAKFGARFLATQRFPWIRKEHLDQTHAYFERYGNKTIVIARFAPFVRTFAPFVAGIGRMSYRQFGLYNIVGGCAWVLLCTTAGVLFGNIPWVKQRFSIVVLGIVFVSILPIVWEAARNRLQKPKP